MAYTDWTITTAGPVTLNLLDTTRKPPPELLSFDRNDPVFILPPFDMKPRSLASLQIEKVQGLLSQLNPRRAIGGMQLEFVQPLSLVLNGQIYPLRNVLTPVDVVPQIHVARALLSRCQRLSDNTTIALTGTAEITIKGRELVIMMIAKKDKAANGSMSMRAHFYDRAGQQTTLPEGVVMGHIAVD